MLSKTLKAILEAGAQAGPKSGPSVALLREVWPTLLGDPLCHRTRPEGFSDGVLTVGVADEAWLDEMRRNRRRLLHRIDSRLPWTVDKLDFVVVDLPAAASRPDDTDAAPQPPYDAARLGAELEDELDRVDPGTRELLLKIRSHIDQQ
jgi:hypothetical protein